MNPTDGRSAKESTTPDLSDLIKKEAEARGIPVDEYVKLIFQEELLRMSLSMGAREKPPKKRE